MSELTLEKKFCQDCGNQLNVKAEICPACGVAQQRSIPAGSKNKIVAFILAWFLGGFGAHKFYTGKIGLGILYAVFFWTLIPAIAAFVEGIIYLTMTDEAFAVKYG